MSNTDLTNEHVVVTGGGGALGGAVVDALVEAGATVHVPVRKPDAPASLAGRDRVVVATGVDLTNEDAVAAFYAGLPGLWASVHTTGGFAAAPITETALADFSKQIALNANTAFLCCREAVRAMGSGGGRIVNVVSRPALEPTGGMIAYTAAKAAVASLTQCLAAEVVGAGILVNAIAPSIIDTPANRKAMPDANFDAWPKPAQLAATIRFLASPANALTTGALVPVYGTL